MHGKDGMLEDFDSLPNVMTVSEEWFCNPEFLPPLELVSYADCLANPVSFEQKTDLIWKQIQKISEKSRAGQGFPTGF